MDKIRLSKKLAYILRHNPLKYNLVLDRYGFAILKRVAEALGVEEEEIRELVKNQEKKRFEIKGNKIRALYGHSAHIEITYKPSSPPSNLYHGTSRKMVKSIEKEGLKPMQRKYVHLSKDIEDAIRVGKRKDPNPVVFVIDAEKAHKDGITFYKAGPVFLVDYLPPQYIKEILHRS
ncbi:MAG TPA: RNA 2'-phosphotransferase [candidate division WOR-3 bacterium]|uniref:Probable RNA 2'-phosphotransferase n=1 Tax=candidate division WOR-3 bacterium TaxID=2052148 RepID=A0A7V5HN22_UNCW3|nr:RNA 2'-phosphotransferase [candidate division WOR-3 bacterium]